MSAAQEEPDVYGARHLKRERRTKARLEQLDRQILDVMASDHPQSVRHMFYEMTNPRLAEPVPKTDHGIGNGYKAVQSRMKKLREEGRLPYNWVTDATRRGFHTFTYRDKSEFLRRVKGLYRADLWEHSAYYCVAVSLYPSGGFTSLTLAYQAADYINDECQDRPVVIFYVGDYDPSGVLIDVAIERELRKHLRPEINLQLEQSARDYFDGIAEYLRRGSAS